MESTEDMQKYIVMAHSLSSQAKIRPQTGEDSALQHMGALLATNCQKLCIGPSFHFCTDKEAQAFTESLNRFEMKETMDEASDDEKYDTVIYKGPDEPYEIVEDESHTKRIQQNLKCEPMNVRLAQASEKYGGLLSPHFFLRSPGSSSSHLDRDTTLPSDIVSNCSENDNQCQKTPFAFPNISAVPSEEKENAPLPSDNIAQRLERIEMLDEIPGEDETEWVEWPKKFIESRGFSLGIQPGDFYREESRPFFYVKLPHLSSYEILVTNNNQVPCDLDLYVDGKLSEALRIPAGASRSIDGPRNSKHAFKAFRAKEAPSGNKTVEEGARQNGLIKAVFTPCKVDSARLRSVSEPLPIGMHENDLLDILEGTKAAKKKRTLTIVSDDQDNVERSLDLSQVTEAVTLLQGKKKKRNYVVAPEMETDLSKRVVLQLRLVISLDEEVTAIKEEIYDLEPPPLPSKGNN